MAIVLDMHPAEAGLHLYILVENLAGAIALRADVRRVEDRDESRVIDLLVQLGHELTILADEVGLNFQPIREVAAVAHLGDLAELIGSLSDVLPRIHTL